MFPCCDSPQIYIPGIQTYICSFNAYNLYLLYRYLKIFSDGMTYSVYLLGCGIQDREARGSIPRGGRVSSRLQNIQTLLGPTQPPFKWMKKMFLPRQDCRSLKLITHFRQVTRLRIRRDIPLLSPYACLACAGTTLLKN